MENPHSTSLSAVFSNLSKAAEKQQNYDLGSHYSDLSQKYQKEVTPGGTLEELKDLVVEDLESVMVKAKAVALDAGDRGAQRALKWGDVVGKIQKSLLDRYIKKGDQAFEGKNFYVCQACGFIYVGAEEPKLCAACKAPASRFEKIK